ncbi:MAG: glycosyltransferase [Patescibacteria group bacterium]|jgi:lipopolysaccharide biosynthesis glycosyltransferase
MKKKALFVTLADKNYLEYAKQVFAGAYFNAGWQGDYMLLAHDCTQKDTQWFQKKKILVKHYKPIYQNQIADTPPVIISKLYLFTPEFKKWSHIIYYDVDIIIRTSLERLLGVKGFASVEDVYFSRLESEIVQKGKIISRGISIAEFKKLKLNLKHKYDFNDHNFGAGMFVLNTNLIKNETFYEIKKIIDDYHKIAANADEFALNMYFYKNWRHLSPIYDVYVNTNGKNQWNLPLGNIEGMVMHIIGPVKPWNKKCVFYKEWEEMYGKSDQIDLKNVLSGKKWNIFKKIYWSYKYKTRNIIYNVGLKYYLQNIFYYHWRQIYYRIVIYFENKYPKKFKIVKNIKKEITGLFR